MEKHGVPDQTNGPIAFHHADDAVIAEFVRRGPHLGPLRGPHLGPLRGCPPTAARSSGA